MNGADALLHLLRASLRYSKRKFGSRFLFDLAKQVVQVVPGQAPSENAALQLLTDPSIRHMKLFVEKVEAYDQEVYDAEAGEPPRRVPIKETTYYRLQDRVEHLYSILEKLVDHKTDMERKCGVTVKKRLRRYLEGWDFRDVAADGDPFYLRVSTLQTIGNGWVDFARGIHAVTLFGRGFGELLQPRDLACSRWSSLPRNMFYLAARVADLQQIMVEDGDLRCKPRRLCKNVLWHMRQTTFQHCPCTKDGRGKHHDPVQALFPDNFMASLRKKTDVALEEGGAVIFGHNMSLHWYYPDVGDPVKGDPPAVTQNIPVITTTASGLESTSPQPSPPISGDSDSSATATTSGFLSTPGSGNTGPDLSVVSVTSEITTPGGSLVGSSEGGGSSGICVSGKRRLQDTLSSVGKRLKF